MLCRSALYRNPGQEETDAFVELPGGRAEDAQTVFGRAVGCGGVGDAPVDLERAAGEDRAGFPGPVADGDDVIEGPVKELVLALGLLVPNVDVEFLHGPDGIRMDRSGVGPGAEHVDWGDTSAAQQAFRHLGARAVVGAEEQDAQRGIGWGVSASGSQAGVDRFLGGFEQVADPAEVDAVIGLAPIGDGMVLLHETGFVKLPKVVRNQVLGLVEAFGQLLHAQVALRKRAQQLPAQVVRQQFEQGRGRVFFHVFILHQSGLMRISSIEFALDRHRRWTKMFKEYKNFGFWRRQMKKKILGTILLILVISLVLAACGSKTDSSTSGSSGDTTSAGTVDGKALILQKLEDHHGSDIIFNSNKTAEEWSTTLDRMIQYGAKINEEEKQAIIDYLVNQ